MSELELSEEWFEGLSPDKGFGKDFLDYINKEEKKNKVIDVNGLKVFIKSCRIIKEYFYRTSDVLKFDVSHINPMSNIGTITITFNHLKIINGKDLKNISEGASYIEFLINDKNKPQIVFGFRDLIKNID